MTTYLSEFVSHQIETNAFVAHIFGFVSHKLSINERMKIPEWLAS